MVSENKKLKLIEQILQLDSEEVIDDVANYLSDRLADLANMNEIFKPMRENISVEELAKEQNYKPITFDEFKAMAKKIDIQEPIEELQAMLD